jgi:Fe-S-cluster-containing hydrogenase component 2
MKCLKEVPSEERLEKGAVAILECPEKIACNPCQDACPTGAIFMLDITSIPEIDYEKCIGCGSCIQICPGLAIRMIQYNKEQAFVTIPYEYLPIPVLGEEVSAYNSEGEEIGTGKVTKIKGRNKKLGDTHIITIEVSKKIALKVRDFGVVG